MRFRFRLFLNCSFLRRHCEERSDEAIQSFFVTLDCFAPLAMTKVYFFTSGQRDSSSDWNASLPGTVAKSL
jgi:hypothetical protein